MGSTILLGSSCSHWCLPPPPLDDTARCLSKTVGPARGITAPLSLATILSPLRPGHTTTRGTPAPQLRGVGGGGPPGLAALGRGCDALDGGR